MSALRSAQKRSGAGSQKPNGPGNVSELLRRYRPGATTGCGGGPQGTFSSSVSERPYRGAVFYQKRNRGQAPGFDPLPGKTGAGSLRPRSRRFWMPRSDRACRSENELSRGSLGTIPVSRPFSYRFGHTLAKAAKDAKKEALHSWRALRENIHCLSGPS
jgi:hypothetical protein